MILLKPLHDIVAARSLMADIEALHVDRGYDNNPARVAVADVGIDDLVCARKRKRGTAVKPKPAPSGRGSRGTNQLVAIELRSAPTKH